MATIERTSVDVDPDDDADLVDLREGKSTDGATTVPETSGRGGASLRYEPALDGLRGLAVAGVLFFHGQFSWAKGGFLGVSTFFTLSGFLITSLLLTERERSGSIDLKHFWSRRFRRLMPASLACLAGISVLFGWFVADPHQLANLRGDVIAALAYVANWRFIVQDQSYADLFTAPSPVQHFWSLAIEEQFYVVFPLLVFGVLRVARGSRKALGVVLGLLTVGSLALMLSLYQPGRDTAVVYYSTFTRAAELLVGALLAVLLAGRGPIRRAAAVVAISIAGVAGLAVTIYWWMTTDQTESWLFEGGLFVYALVSAILILAAINVVGPVRAWLSRRTMVGLGRISYGVYLYHWPIFLWLTPERTGWALGPLFVVRVAVTLAVAILSFRYLETPIRARLRLTGPRAWLIAPAAALTVAMAVVLVTINPPTLTDPATAGAEIETPELSPEDLAAQAAQNEDQAGPMTTPAVDRVLLMGDSVMAQAWPFFEARFDDQGITTGFAGGEGEGPLSPQGKWQAEIDQWVQDFDPDVVVIEACCDYVGTTDQIYRMPDGREVLPNTDLVYEAWDLVARDMIQRAGAGGARVFWVLSPPVDTNGFYGPMEDHVGRLNAIYRELPVRLIDWATPSSPYGSPPDGQFSESLPIGPNGESVVVRAADGLHYTPEGDDMLAEVTLRAMLQLGTRPGF